ncbi:uncharacterized protein BO66DRAFT_26556 [Aspergillus aculeatinus CBS 121060]|uniref:Uncharacterized protein n=1 Tax=Aspergillus aculeatinus CBS 121060 TaxID=1448322 RepID=A0ACD1HGG9_9EURO|nr:hypothetical protein BO66DRAFT_26556 [Aspergillus aculeatinus CBS 121060]RAH72590.1 hypothetical protein BO66DRAFT_26556 [Aspergillus aculeatinus CBS 121060]
MIEVTGVGFFSFLVLVCCSYLPSVCQSPVTKCIIKKKNVSGRSGSGQQPLKGEPPPPPLVFFFDLLCLDTFPSGLERTIQEMRGKFDGGPKGSGCVGT